MSISSKPDTYRAVIDDLVRMCFDGQGQIGPERVRLGLWNRNAATPEFDSDQYAFNQLLTRMSSEDRAIVARMLELQTTTGVFETLKALEAHEVTPFEDGYEGGPCQDFVGRMAGWQWPA